MAHDWQPRLLAHRARLAEMVALYGPVTHPPGSGDAWSGRFTFTDGRRFGGVRPGSGHCMWCGGYSHRPGCPVHREERLAALARDIPLAEAALQAATSRLAALLAERGALGGAP